MNIANALLGLQQMGKLLVADDHKMVGEGIERLLRHWFESTTLVTSGEALVEAVRDNQPDIVIAEVCMPGICGIEAMEIVREEGHTMPFVFLTMHDEPSLATEAIRRGARGFIHKSASGSELGQALRTIVSGKSYVTPSLVAPAIRGTPPPLHQLTERRLDILSRIWKGFRSKQIADQLGISVRTVESHKYVMMQMLGVHSTLELINRCEQEGWLPPKGRVIESEISAKAVGSVQATEN